MPKNEKKTDISKISGNSGKTNRKERKSIGQMQDKLVQVC